MNTELKAWLQLYNDCPEMVPDTQKMLDAAAKDTDEAKREGEHAEILFTQMK